MTIPTPARIYLWQMNDETLLVGHELASIIWAIDSESIEGRKAFDIMDACAFELNGRGYSYTFDSPDSSRGQWHKA